MEEQKEETLRPVQEGNEDGSQENDLLEILLNTREQGQMIEQFIKKQIEVKDGIIDKLHKELSYYKQDSADKFTEQLMKAVIKVRRDMRRLISSSKWDTLSAEELRNQYTYIFEDLTDLLQMQNVDEFVSSEGDAFDPMMHQVKIETTTDSALDKQIKTSLSEGYKKGGKVLIQERVVVYQYKD